MPGLAARVLCIAWQAVPFMLVMIGVGGYLLFFATSIHGRGDEGLILYPAERVLAGQVPYRDFFSELAPGSFYLQALWFWLFGTHVLSARLPLVFVMALIATELFWLSRRLLPGWRALVPVLVYAVAAFPRWMVVSHHWYSLFFSLAALVGVVRFLESRKRAWLVGAGILTAAAALTMQNKGIMVGLALGLFLAFERRGQRRQAVVAYAAGVLALGLPVLAFFRAQGALGALGYSTGIFIFQNYLPFEFQPLPYIPWHLWQLVARHEPGKLLAQIGWSVVVPMMAAVAVRSPNRRSGEQARLRTLYAIAAFTLLASEMHRFDLVHMLLGVPLLVVLAAKMLDFDPGSAAWRRPARAALAVIALFYVMHGAALARREHRRDAPIWTRRGVLYQTPDRARDFQELVTAVESRVPAGEATFIYPYDALLYFLTATVNPTRFDYLLPGQTTRAQFAEVTDCLKDERAPRLVFSFWKDRKEKMKYFYPRVPASVWKQHPLEDYLLGTESPHRPILECSRFIIFRDDTLAAARQMATAP